jgi:hypothetical protein
VYLLWIAQASQFPLLLNQQVGGCRTPYLDVVQFRKLCFVRCRPVLNVVVRGVEPSKFRLG